MIFEYYLIGNYLFISFQQKNEIQKGNTRHGWVIERERDIIFKRNFNRRNPVKKVFLNFSQKFAGTPSVGATL